MTTKRDLSKSRILLVNDDGIDAPGIRALRDAVGNHYDVRVVAPLQEQSGSGCGLTVHSEFAVEKRGERDWAVDGTPADCVKFALMALDGYRPDLVLSGINNGGNMGNSVFYSGTVAGAMEATFFGLRALAVSLSHRRDGHRHFETAAEVVRDLIPWLLTHAPEPRTFWNLNVPNVPFGDLKGLRYTHQGTSFYTDEFAVEREENGRLWYRNVGTHSVLTPEPSNSDDLVVDGDAASLSLLRMDLSVDLPGAAREAMEREWNQFVFGKPDVREPGTR